MHYLGNDRERSRKKSSSLLWFDRDDADFAGGLDNMQQAAQAAKALFTKPKFRCPDRRKTRVAEPPRPGFRDLEAQLPREIAQSLRVPRIKMMIRFVRNESVVFRLPFQRREKKKFAPRREQPAHFPQNSRRVAHMFQCVMAQHHVHRSIGNTFCFGDVFNAQGADGGFQKISDVKADLAVAFQHGEIPAQADPVLEDDVGGADGWGKFFGAQPRDPGEGGVRDAAFVLLVAASGFALIMALCWLREHGAQSMAAQPVGQSNFAGSNSDFQWRSHDVADGTLHLPLPVELRTARLKVTAIIQDVRDPGERPTKEDALAALRKLRELGTFKEITDPVA